MQKLLLFALTENEEVVIICTGLQDMKGFYPGDQDKTQQLNLP